MPVNFSFDHSFQNGTRTGYTNVIVSQRPGNNETIKRIADNITMLQANFSFLE